MAHRGRGKYYRRGIQHPDTHAYVTDLQNEILAAYAHEHKELPRLSHKGAAPDGLYGDFTRHAFAGLDPQAQDAIMQNLAHHHAPAPAIAADLKRIHGGQAVAAAPETARPNISDMGKTAVFDLRTGQIYLPNDPDPINAGSGKGVGKNNPAKEAEADLGPIPEGMWNVAPPRLNTYQLIGGKTDTTMSLRLEPAAGTQTYGRKGFLIHHTHAADKSDLHSIGCLVTTDKDMKKLIAARDAGMFTQLVVTRDARALALASPPKNVASRFTGIIPAF